MSDPVIPPPPPPFNPQPDPPKEMSVGETLTGIFFEPGRVFESFRERPRFLVAAIVSTIAIFAFTTIFFQKVGFERLITEAVESSPRADQMTAEQKEQSIRIQTGPVVKAIYYASPLIAVAIIIAGGAALYLLGSMLIGKKLGYKQSLAVWTYSGMPPIIIAMLLNIVLLFIKSPDDYDIVRASRRGLVQANLGVLVDLKASPVLGSLLSSFDLIQFYGLFLAAVGLRKVAKMSSGSAWTIVLAIWSLGVIIRLALAAITGGGM
jgi:hypothetical protein